MASKTLFVFLATALYSTTLAARVKITDRVNGAREHAPYQQPQPQSQPQHDHGARERETSQSDTTADSAQMTTILYIVPIFATLIVLASPCLFMASLFAEKITEAVNRLIRDAWAEPKRLTQLSLISLLLCPFFLLSNTLKSTLAMYGLFGALLANANICVDAFAKRRGWLVLLVWHALNLLQMMGGSFAWLQFYGKSLLLVAQQGPLGADQKCGRTDIAWCSDGYITIQVVIAAAYLVLHVCTFIVVSSRVIKEYGGEAMPEEQKTKPVTREELIEPAQVQAAVPDSSQ